MINKITTNLENFHYNVIIANFHEIYNFLYKVNKSEGWNSNTMNENYIKILYVMKPVLPHLISECLFNLNIENGNKWPAIDKKRLEEKFVNIVVQINGKKRGLINCKKDITEGDLIKIIDDNDDLKKYFDIVEVPVIFTDRKEGKSKMDTSIFFEAFIGVIQMKISSLFTKFKQKPKYE